MPIPLIECVPNFSEARRPEVIDAIQGAIASVVDIHVLDRHSDLDHNRTVITFAGPPQAVEEAAFQGIACAAELIDLNQHSGEHPRIGATDVVPFIPVSGASMQDCVEIARRLGKRVGEELDIPVYLYESAATRPDRKNLESIRRGEYEILKREITSNADRKPDFGPQVLGPAGATVIGARSFLIAFNVYLSTDEIAVAEKIARSVRHSSGGMRYVKALGMLVDGMAQVSMNLTNFRKTPVAQVVEFIRREAARYGTVIHHSELVGLIPQDALEDAAVWYLQLDQFLPDQVLEKRLYAAFQADPASVGRPGTSSQVDHGFLEALSAATPTPGGGSAAAYAASMAAALLLMVARLTIGKKKYVDVEQEMVSIETKASQFYTELVLSVSEDAAAFQSVMEAYRLPKQTAEEIEQRSAHIQAATLHAAEVPLNVAQKSVELLKLAQQLVLKGNINAISDAGSAAALAGAGLMGAGLNVRINAPGLDDKANASRLIEEIDNLERQGEQLGKNIREQLNERGGLS